MTDSLGTLFQIDAQFYWCKHEDIKHYIWTCLVCQLAKTNTTLPWDYYNLPQILKKIWKDIAMDFITGLPPSNSYTVIMVVMDMISKYVHFSTLKTDYSSKQVVKSFMKSISSSMGFLRQLYQSSIRFLQANFGSNCSS